MSLNNLDLAIGLIMVILVLSLICMAINEWIAQLMALRSGTLRNGITQILEDDLARQLYAHPLVQSLSQKGRFDRLLKRPGDPSYIPSDLFATALLDIAANASAPDGAPPTDGARETVAKLPDGRAKSALLAILDQMDDDITTARAAAEQWFDAAMERVSGQYKRRIQIVTIGVAVAVTVVANADALVIADSLREDPIMREALVALATETVNENAAEAGTDSVDPPTDEGDTTGSTNPATDQGDEGTGAEAATEPETVTTEDTPEELLDKAQIARLLKQTDQIQLPLGWADTPKDSNAWVAKALGLLLTAAAISLGAPFWFDMLGKIVHIRATGPVPSGSGDQS